MKELKVFFILQTSILMLSLSSVVLIEEEGGTFTKRCTVLSVIYTGNNFCFDV